MASTGAVSGSHPVAGVAAMRAGMDMVPQWLALVWTLPGTAPPSIDHLDILAPAPAPGGDGSAQLGGAEPAAIRSSGALVCGLDVRASLAAMAFAMAYMLAAMVLAR